MDAIAAEPDSLPRGIGVISKHWTMIAGLVAAIGYGAGRWYFGEQFRDLGVAPEEVGLNEIGILGRLFPVLCLAVLYLALAVLGIFLLLLMPTTTTTHRVAGTVCVVIAIMGIGGGSLSLLDRYPKAELAWAQESVIDATCVSVAWISRAPQSDPLIMKNTVWFLGSHEGTGVFLQTVPNGFTTIRLPMSGLALVSSDPTTCAR